MKNKILALLLFGIFLTMPAAKKLTTPPPDVLPDNRYEAIVRLVENNRTYCTGSVISDQIVITAAHCLSAFGQVMIMDQYKNTIKVAQVYSVLGKIDQAVLVGDFREFKKLYLKPLTNGLEGSKGPFKTCGYAYGGKLLCFDFIPSGIDYFFISAKSHIYPGMSGGPVIDTSTNEVVAVNYAVKENMCLVSPLVNFLEIHGIISEE